MVKNGTSGPIRYQGIILVQQEKEVQAMRQVIQSLGEQMSAIATLTRDSRDTAELAAPTVCSAVTQVQTYALHQGAHEP